ncbi:plastocyanin/azurin family copper-binding protein [Haloquadratum walsbyi]|jgi:Plastocyanin|uniref:Plastocyanin n=1 Tax=Haloquadratum walsbyi J07HQW2 TaxID=1238425 RepID=U1PS04_9EURY|nr:plastocyanin/azurin family copper-binding protein [Haloquadratum walsbyi]ERG96562.1 MAG: plastocyanin [Haloquadratum walsbyi J07HQW2]
MSEESTELSRRTLLTTAVGSATAGGAIGTATAQEGGNSTTVTVGPGGSFVFEPGTNEALEITPGTTVEFVWDSDNHNIVVESQPDGENWEGHDTLENAGFSYTHTFETLGTYEYFCQPHKTAGMGASIDVVESISTPVSSNVPTVPDSAKTLGVATTFAMVATLGLGFFFLKYGGDYDIEE